MTSSPLQTPPSKCARIVGVGASAGGLEAFRQLLHHLPANTGFGFVFVQHLDPTHPSLLCEALRSSTSMPVVEATDGVVVDPDHVYVIPSDARLALLDGALHLEPRQGRQPQMLFDHFLRTLAIDCGENAVGVVLSGTASDGTLGLAAIKAAGGVTFAQQPETAAHPGMPESANAAGAVDFVLPLDRLAHRLAALGKAGKPAAVGPNGELEPVLHLLRIGTGVDFSQYKQTTVRRRVARRMAARRATTLEQYAALLANEPLELNALYEDIFIHVTEFFRDPEVFALLKERVFPELVKDKAKGGPLRIWTAACASGEETYSVAIALMEFLGEQAQEFSIQIFGTDISDETVQRARAGVYTEAACRPLSPARLGQFFTRVEACYRINKSIRERCVFVRHDLGHDPPFSKIDLITCRNTLIYFGAEQQRRVISTFHYALNQPGFLVLGRSESPSSVGDLFTPLDKSAKVFSRRATVARLPVSFQVGSRAAERARVSGPPPERTMMALDWQREADQLLLARYAPAGVIVDENLEILQFRGRTSPYLEPAPGLASLNLLKMARPGLVVDLRRAFQAVKEQHVAVRRAGVRLKRDGAVGSVVLEVIPLRAPLETASTQYLVLFDEARGEEQPPHSSPAELRSPAAARSGNETADTSELEALQQELAATREFLQSEADQHAHADEELRAINQDLLSTNEELHSTNEELETAKEELNSGNEELVTLNGELENSNQELRQLSLDLTNLFTNLDIPVLILDRERRVRRFTPGARDLLNLIPGDVGRAVNDIKPNIDAPELDAWLKEVLATAVAKEVEVRDRDGRWNRLQIRPYRNSEGAIDGLVVVLLDVDALHRGVEQARTARDYANSIVEAVQTPLLILDQGLHVRSVNAAFTRTFQPQIDARGATLDQLGPGPWRDPEIQRQLTEGPFGGEPLASKEVECELPGLGPRTFAVSQCAIDSDISAERHQLLALNDVTLRHQAEADRTRMIRLEEQAAAAEAAAAAKDAFLAVLSHELRTPLNAILLWAQLLQLKRVDPAKLEQGLKLIARSARHQARLVNDLLDVSRIVAGKLQVTLKPIAVGPVLEEVVAELQSVANDKGVRLELGLTDCADIVRADADRLRQILWNLIANAVKFTPAEGSVSVALHRDGERVRITVRDSGIGIAPEFLPHVFDRFAQADESTTRAGGGLGLGLAIVTHLVECHGGSLTATSPGLGSGATFTVTFPSSAEVPTRGAADTPVGDSPDPSALDGLEVMVLDDDRVSREALWEVLSAHGAKVTMAASVAEALAKLDEHLPHLVLCDLAMPEQDGYAFVRQLRLRSAERGSLTCVVALTALATAEDRRRTMAAGFQAHLTKPLEAAQLLAVVRRLASQPPPADAG